jgi:tripartite-type tricarboxylate transporter receptor subunit TctC
MQKLGFASAAFTVALGTIGVATAQVYPSRPITMVVPFPAGGATDALARILSEPLKTALGQPVLVENVSGAGGSIGVARVARAAPDGHTLSIGQWTSHVGSGAMYQVTYDLLNDFAPIALIASTPQWIAAKKDFPAKDLKEMVAWLKANPDKASAATYGTGSGPHICALYLQSNVGVRFQIVPYRGAAPAMHDLLGGQIDFVCEMPANSLANVQAGRLKAYAVMAKNRWFAAPDVPTAEEQGFPGLDLPFWHGLWAPKGTPEKIVGTINRAIVNALADDTVRKRFADQGQGIPSREQQTPEALAAYHRAEIEKWWPIIKAANLKGD